MNATFKTALRNELVSAVPRHRRRVQRRRVAAAACAVVAALAIGLTAALVAEGDTSSVQAGPGPTPTSPAAVTEPSTTATTTVPEPSTTGPEPSTTPTNPVPGGPSLNPGDVEQSAMTVRAFLDRLRSGDTVGAGELWTGNPEAIGTPPEDVQTQISGLLDQFQQAFGWLLDDPEPDLIVTPSPSDRDPIAIVTVVVDTLEGARRAAPFVMTSPLSSPDVVIDRLPVDNPRTTPAEGSGVAPGETIRISAIPVEGTVRAFVNGVEATSATDLEGRFIEVVIPETAEGAVTLSVGIATPEAPDALAAWFPVSP